MDSPELELVCSPFQKIDKKRNIAASNEIYFKLEMHSTESDYYLPDRFENSRSYDSSLISIPKWLRFILIA